ncbi:MAG: dihydroorotate dehydrogenase electron transfer subunit, partial [Eubacteriales bacterium]|nr:dihydroorotate dehydrogenase electron transfer subunit [Eubacteriales bacterium]
ELGICTDDGTFGSKGFVTELLEDELKKGKKYTIYSCGPGLMMKRVAELAEKYDVKCQLSLEQRMGCGIGACLLCSCKIRTSNENGWHYARVCKDGPVFWSSDIIWE